ncbi:MAG: RadC family protein [Sphaerochaeta sp.]|uniref:JAB domain-containing protein n=1 Tax=Sphaerochaeta sp. TaxID=1972642 RepID=UPI003D1449D2
MKYLITQPTEQRIKEMAVCDRPRERMLSRGAESLSDQELLAILIGSGNRERSVNAIAKDLMEILDTKASISNEDLLGIPGLGMAKATLIAASLELGRRRLPAKRRQISTPSDIFPLIRHYATRMQEHFLSVCLNGAHEVLSVNVCSIGLVNRTLVHPRDVLASTLIQSY